MNPTSRLAARYQGGFFTRGVGSADRINFKALHPRSRQRGIRANVIKKSMLRALSCLTAPILLNRHESTYSYLPKVGIGDTKAQEPHDLIRGVAVLHVVPLAIDRMDIPRLAARLHL